MSSYQLKNGSISVSVDTAGAGLTSIMDANGKEYLWQGNPDYWTGQAPVLFPICGSLRNGQASIGGGKTCTMGRHGIARRCEFTLRHLDTDSVSFFLKADEETKAAFPYNFELQMTYRIDGCSVAVEHTVTNYDSQIMPYFVGGHPAFHCPMNDGEAFEDYVIEFEQPETAACPMLTEDGLVNTDSRKSLLNQESVFGVKHELFYDDALIFDTLASRTASLIHRDTKKGIRVDFADFDYLGIWSSANDGPFVAIEPWSGTSTCTSEDDIFEHKRGVRMLDPGQSETLSYTISVI
ncbi:aldose 1-epimerase family protein [Anaerostipes sp.]|uniref:aldose 1-epimerase family protein n=1 Tax=Anaerostipes sp. TaxID=1872530 RepID=UPI0025C5EA9E|nr:aldose 1-epimerase family protein [Anaerostipes sp.]MBS7007809.1 aldose 1-epimerase family protein [Anaerostipes sp.]